MDTYPLQAEIVSRFGEMSRQLQQAARYLLENPQDVALLSMRDQARNAGVQPATMTRLAKFLGLSGYDEVRSQYHGALRDRSGGFSERARQLVHEHELDGDRALAARMFARLSHQIQGLTDPSMLQTLSDAAGLLSSARRVYCLGQRSCHPVVWQFNYMNSLLGERSVILDGAGGTGHDVLTWAQKGDVLFILTVNPYARITYDLAKEAKDRGLTLIVLTDSEVAPIRTLADLVLFVPTDSLSFFHSMTPAFALCEVLASMIAARPETRASEGLRETESRLERMSTYIRS